MSILKVGGKLQAALIRLQTVKNISMKVGVLNGATNGETGEKIAQYAAANEFGTLTAPARPAFRNTIASKSDSWGGALSALMDGKAVNDTNLRSAFNGLGTLMVQDIRDTIEEGDFTPLAPATVESKRKKGRAEPNKPLVDTGDFQRAIDFEIMGDDQ